MIRRSMRFTIVAQVPLFNFMPIEHCLNALRAAAMYNYKYTSSVQGLSVSTTIPLNGANNAICFYCAEYVAAF